MGPFTIQSVLSKVNGSKDNHPKEDKDAAAVHHKKPAVSPTPPQLGRSFSERGSNHNKHAAPNSAGSLTARKADRGVRPPASFLTPNNPSHLTRRSYHGQQQNQLQQKQKQQPDNGKPQLGDLDSSSEEEDDEDKVQKPKKKKSLEETTFDLIAQATKSPASNSSTNTTISSVMAAMPSMPISMPSMPSLPRTSFRSSRRAFSTNDASDVSKIMAVEVTTETKPGDEENQTRDATTEEGHNKQPPKELTTAQRVAQRLARKNSSQDSQDQPPASAAATVMPNENDLGYSPTSSSLNDIDAEDDNEEDHPQNQQHQQQHHVRRIAPRRYSSGGKLDAKLERAAGKNANTGPATAPTMGNSSASGHSLDSGASASTNGSDNAPCRVPRRRTTGGRRGLMMQRSSSARDIVKVIENQQQLTHSLHSSMSQYGDDDDDGHHHPHDGGGLSLKLDLGYNAPHEQGGMPSPEELYGDMMSRSTPAGKGARRKSMGYGQLDDEDDSDHSQRQQQHQQRHGSIGFGTMGGDTSRREGSRRQRRNLSIGNGNSGEQESSSRQQRKISMGHGNSGEGEHNMRQLRKGSMEHANNDSEREPSLRQHRKTSMGPSNAGRSISRERGDKPNRRHRGSVERKGGADRSISRDSSERCDKPNRRLRASVEPKSGADRSISRDNSERGDNPNRRRRGSVERKDGEPARSISRDRRGKKEGDQQQEQNRRRRASVDSKAGEDGSKRRRSSVSRTRRGTSQEKDGSTRDKRSSLSSKEEMNASARGKGALDSSQNPNRNRQRRVSVERQSSDSSSKEAGKATKRLSDHTAESSLGEKGRQTRKVSSDDGADVPGKLDRQLAKQKAAAKLKAFNDSKSENSHGSGESLVSAKSGRAAKLDRMLNKQEKPKVKSFHDSIKSGTSTGSAESTLSTMSGPAAAGKSPGRRGSKKKPAMMYEELVSKYTKSPQRDDSDTDDDGSEREGSSRSCHSALGRAHQAQELNAKARDVALVRSASSSMLGSSGSFGNRGGDGLLKKGKKLRTSVKNQGLAGLIPKRLIMDDAPDDDGSGMRNRCQDRLGVRSFSLNEPRTRGNQVVRTFSMRNAVGGLLHSDRLKNSAKSDDESVEDEIIGYGDDENSDSNGGDSSERSESDHDESDLDDKPVHSGSSEKHVRVVSSQRTKTEAQRLRDRSGSGHSDEDGDVAMDNSDRSSDIWDEFENGSIIDSDSFSSGSDRTEDMMMSSSCRIVNWDDPDKDVVRSDYLDPSMSPRMSSSQKHGMKPVAQIDLMPLPMQSRPPKKQVAESKRASLLGGFQLDDDSLKDSSVVGGSAAGSVEGSESSKHRRSLKTKRSKKDLIKNGGFDWEGKAKEDKKRESKKKKDDLLASQHSKKDGTKKSKLERSESAGADGMAQRTKIKRSSSLKGFGKCGAMDTSGHKKKIPRRSPRDSLKRSQSVGMDSDTDSDTVSERRVDQKRSSCGHPAESSHLTLKSEKKRSASVATVAMLSASSHAKSERHRSKSPTAKWLDESKAASKSRRSSRSKSPAFSALDSSKSNVKQNSSNDKSNDKSKSSSRGSVEAKARPRSLKRANTVDECLEKEASSSKRKSGKGVRRTKSLGLSGLKGTKGRDSTRASSVKRANSGRIVSEDKSRLRKKKAAEENESTGDEPNELQKLLVSDPKGAADLIRTDPSKAEEKDNSGCLPLHFAAQRAIPVDVFDMLIETYPEACEAQCDNGFTPLHFAVENDIPTPQIKALIKASPRALKTQDRKGQIPLHIAASQNASLSSIRLLVFIYPESVDIETAKGETARKIAKRKKASAEVLNELKSRKSSNKS